MFTRKQPTQDFNLLRQKAEEYLEKNYSRHKGKIIHLEKGYVLEPDSINGMAKVSCTMKDSLNNTGIEYYQPRYLEKDGNDFAGCEIEKKFKDKISKKNKIHWENWYNTGTDNNGRRIPQIYSRYGGPLASESASTVVLGGRKSRYINRRRTRKR